MRNKGTEISSDLMEIPVQHNEWEKRQIQRDAQRFEDKVRQDRIRLGLEVAHV